MVIGAEEGATPGDVLRRARERRGLSQLEMAREIGVSQPTVQNWEADRKRPRGGRLARVAKAYGVDVRRIIPRVAG